jgi:hypothetical protein
MHALKADSRASRNLTAQSELGSWQAPRDPGLDRIVVAHLGMGLTDVLFADAIARTARTKGLGAELSDLEAAELA